MWFSNIFQTISSSANDVGESGRSMDSLEQKLEQYVKSHQVSVEVPLTGATLSLGGRNLENDELDLTIKLNPRSELEGKSYQKIK